MPPKLQGMVDDIEDSDRDALCREVL
jgi:hypothetical protein